VTEMRCAVPLTLCSTQLFDESVPKTAENFRKLCTGESGDGREGKPLHFKNTIFHRIEEGFVSLCHHVPRSYIRIVLSCVGLLCARMTLEGLQ